VLEELHGPFVPFGAFSTRKSPEIPPLAALSIDLTRVKAVLARLQFANHDNLLGRSSTHPLGRNRLRHPRTGVTRGPIDRAGQEAALRSNAKNVLPAVQLSCRAAVRDKGGDTMPSAVAA
jgi:hypothetical protein